MNEMAAIARASAVLALVSVFGCSSSSSSNGPGSSNLPEVSADKLGQVCTGFGTSEGDSATFKDDTDCKAGFCLVDLTGSDFESYCTADCDKFSCPSGYTCKSVTLGDTTHSCFADTAPDGG